MRRLTRLLGWGLIGLVGGGASALSVVLLALIVVLTDVYLLETTPAGTDDLTIVRQKATAIHPDGSWHTYEVRSANGTLSDAQLPWVVQPGDRVRFKNGRTRILGLTIPTEAPVICSLPSRCD